MRFIYKCFLTARAGHYTMTCRPMSNSNGKQRVLTFHGSKEWMRTQLLRMKANDKVVDPPSKNRSKIYMQMIDDAEANRDNTIFVWSNLLPKDNSLKEKAIKERLDVSFFDQFMKDIRTFMKNINRMKRYDQIVKANRELQLWHRNVLKKVEKKIMGREFEPREKGVTAQAFMNIDKTVKNMYTFSDTQLTKYFRDFKKEKRDEVLDIFRSHADPESSADTFFNYSTYTFHLYQSAMMEEMAPPVLKSMFSNTEIGDLRRLIVEWYYDRLKQSKYISVKTAVDRSEERLRPDFEFEVPSLGIKGMPDSYVEEKTVYKGVNFFYTSMEGKAVWEIVKKIHGKLTSMVDFFARKPKLKPMLTGFVVELDFLKGSLKGQINGKPMDAAGLYNINSGQVQLAPNETDAILFTFAHEIGHKYYYEQLTPDQRNRWEQFFEEAKESDMMPTEYSKNNPSEFFAEVSAVYWLKDLNYTPEEVHKFKVNPEVFEYFKSLAGLRESFFESKSSAKDWVARLTEMPHFMVKNEPYDLELELHTKDSENDLRSYLKKLVNDSPKELKDEIISSNIIKLFITNKFGNDAYQRIMKDL